MPYDIEKLQQVSKEPHPKTIMEVEREKLEKKMWNALSEEEKSLYLKLYKETKTGNGDRLRDTQEDPAQESAVRIKEALLQWANDMRQFEQDQARANDRNGLNRVAESNRDHIEMIDVFVKKINSL